MIAVMLGDFVHNLRCALDYVIVACVPPQRRKSASFPILFTNIFAKDKDGKFVVDDADGRADFETAVHGLHTKARTIVTDMQPFHAGNERHRHTLGLVSRLDNADKHRRLTVAGAGVANITATVSVRGEILAEFTAVTNREFAKDDTEVGYTFPSSLSDWACRPSEMNMHFSGTAKILVKITRIGGNEPSGSMRLDEFMPAAIEEVSFILQRLEFFAKT